MAGLTQAQADLLYAAIAHLHEGVYSPIAHLHDHGVLTGLGDDDHTQYFNETRGDARYALLSHGHDHGALTGLGDDDHTQYFEETRGDARYLKKSVSQFLPASSALTLTTSYQDVPGLSVSLSEGLWMVCGVIDARPGAETVSVLGQLMVGSTAETRLIVCRSTSGTFWATVSQMWQINLTEAKTVSLQVRQNVISNPWSTVQTASALAIWPV